MKNFNEMLQDFQLLGQILSKDHKPLFTRLEVELTKMLKQYQKDMHLRYRANYEVSAITESQASRGSVCKAP